MPHADFVHLRVHSAYSLSEGAIKADKLAGLAAFSDNMPAVAITDTSNMFGTLEFTQYCTKSGVQPIIGCQLGSARTGTILAPDYVVALAQNEERLRQPPAPHLPLLSLATPSNRKSPASSFANTRGACSCSPAARSAPSAGCWRRARWRRPKPISPP